MSSAGKTWVVSEALTFFAVFFPDECWVCRQGIWTESQRRRFSCCTSFSFLPPLFSSSSSSSFSFHPSISSWTSSSKYLLKRPLPLTCTPPVPCILVFSFSSSLQCFAIYHPKPIHVLNLKRTWASVHANASTGSLSLKLSTLPHCVCKLFSFVLHSREGKDAGCLEKFPNSHLILMTVGSKIPCSGDISTGMLWQSPLGSPVLVGHGPTVQRKTV